MVCTWIRLGENLITSAWVVKYGHMLTLVFKQERITPKKPDLEKHIPYVKE